MAASSTSSALRLAVDSIEVLNLGGVWLKASLAFFAVAFGVSGSDAGLQSACGGCEQAGHAGAEQLPSSDCCLPFAHERLTLFSGGHGGAGLGRGSFLASSRPIERATSMPAA